MNRQHQDADFARWTSEWQSSTPDPDPTVEEMLRYIRRRERLMRSFFIADSVIVAVALPVVAYFAWRATGVVERAAMVALLAVIVGAACFGWWNWRGVWHSPATTTTAFVALAAARLHRMRIAVRAAWILLAVEMAIFVVWVWSRLYAEGRRPDPAEERFAWLWLAGFSVVFAIALLRFSRWLRRDRAKFEALREELESGVDQSR
jgi:hypothetical protein